ncbi:MAG TPA: hypothetical protein VJ506_05545, partial [Candidatus Limnocylindrales bacterium]|nr:hypothetical protein [Candidatus Limnocylindrales bacterium]
CRTQAAPDQASPERRLVSEARSARSGGQVRAARLTDLAALGELSRLSQTTDANARTLGLPVNGPPIGMFSLFRLPLVAFRPHDLLFVYESDRHLSGLVRVERENWRDDWTVVELDAIGGSGTGEIRHRLLQQVLREGQKRGAVRFHVACADADDNVELFMQAGFVRYGEEHVLYRPPEPPLPRPWTEERAAAGHIRQARPVDANALMQLYGAVTPAPVQRLEAFRIPDWERQGSNWRVPRSSLAPILRFADLDGYVQDSPDGSRIDAFIQIGVAREDQPHYLRPMGRPEIDLGPLVEFGLGMIAAQVDKGSGRPNHGVLAPVRTYEAPADRRLEESGFAEIATVTLLMKETLVRVAEPGLVPAAVRQLEVTRGS